MHARGEIGDGDPLQALEDALREFPADEIVVSTHPPGRSHWLEQGVVENARMRFDVPVTHVVVDLEAARLSLGGRLRLLAGVVGDELRDRLDLLVAQLALEGRHPALAVRDAVDREVASTASPRRGSARRFPLEPAAASVWQPAQPAEAKIALPSVPPPSGGVGFGGFAGSIGSPFASRPATEAT